MRLNSTGPKTGSDAMEQPLISNLGSHGFLPVVGVDKAIQQ